MSNGVIIDYQKVMYQTINYVIHTKTRKLCINSVMSIVDLKRDRFILKGRLDSNYTTNIETRKSTSILDLILNRVLVIMRSVG